MPAGTLTPPLRLTPNLRKVNWAHPLANGLIGCWLPGIHGPVDLCGNHPDLYLQPLSIPGATVEGPAQFSSPGSTIGGMSGQSPDMFKNATQVTLYWRGTPMGSDGASYSSLCGVVFNAGQGPPYLVYNLQLQGDWSSFLPAWNTGGAWTLGPATNLTGYFGQQISVGATFVVGGNVFGYVNGVSVASKAFGASPPNVTPTSTTIINGNNAAGGPSAYSNAHCNIALIYNRALSDDEMAWLDREPYCFLTTAEAALQAFTGAVSSGTLAATEAADQANMVAAVAWSAPLAATESPDTAALLAGAYWSTPLAAVEAPDTAAAAAQVFWLTPLAATESPDTADVAADVFWPALLVASEAADRAAFSGVALTGAVAVLAGQEQPDHALMHLALPGPTTGEIKTHYVTGQKSPGLSIVARKAPPLKVDAQQ
jgi:hypothetical protein